MPNEIPSKIRKKVYERSEGLCEYCGTNRLNNYGANPLGIHHIIKRRNRIHRLETLVLLCSKCHEKAEVGSLNDKLRYLLQKSYYKQGYSDDEVRKLMGGKLYGDSL